jgi:hypothetical protein
MFLLFLFAPFILCDFEFVVDVFTRPNVNGFNQLGLETGYFTSDILDNDTLSIKPTSTNTAYYTTLGEHYAFDLRSFEYIDVEFNGPITQHIRIAIGYHHKSEFNKNFNGTAYLEPTTVNNTLRAFVKSTKNDLLRRGKSIIIFGMNASNPYLIKSIKLVAKYPPLVPDVNLPYKYIYHPEGRPEQVLDYFSKIIINGTTFEHVKHLGEGYNAHAYLYQHNSEKIVLKIAKLEMYEEAIQKSRTDSPVCNPELNALKIFGYYRGDGVLRNRVFQAMSFIAGKKLHEIGGCCKNASLFRIKDFTDAYKRAYMAFYHENMAHGDIGLHNTLFIPTEPGNYCSKVVAKIIDFGSVRLLEYGKFTVEQREKFELFDKCEFWKWSYQLIDYFYQWNAPKSQYDQNLRNAYFESYSSNACQHLMMEFHVDRKVSAAKAAAERQKWTSAKPSSAQC